ncbi:ParA family protein [Aeromonas veronii]
MIVAVAHNKGGVGKTTTVVQLAGELRPEIIIDLDAHQGIAIINGRRPAEQRWDVRAGLDKAALIKLLKAAGKHLVLIDCGGFDSELVRIAIAAADLIIAPSNDDITEQIGLVRFNRVLAEISQAAGEPIQAHVLMTRTNPSRKNFSAISSELTGLTHLTMMTSKLSRRADWANQMESGLGVTERAATRSSAAGMEAKALAEEVRSRLATLAN